MKNNGHAFNKKIQLLYDFLNNHFPISLKVTFLPYNKILSWRRSPDLCLFVTIPQYFLSE